VSLPSIRVLIADDHAVLRAGLRMLLAAQPDMVVLGEAADGAEAVRMAAALRPDVTLIDLSMPGLRSGDAIRQILAACPECRVLVLTMHDDAGYVTSALAAGAAGFVVKKVADTELLVGIRAVHSGRMFVDLSRTPVPHPAADRVRVPKALSRREREVLKMLAEGHSNQEVADQLRVSVKTAETYRTRLREKLGLKGRADLFRFAVESGVLDSSGSEPPV
jgi:two-component system response regulator NreC